MPRHEPSQRAEPGELLKGKVRMRRGPDGRLEVVVPERPTTETTESAERPPIGEDPRSGPLRDVPPFGGI